MSNQKWIIQRNMQYWARGTDEVKQPKHNTENYKKMSNTDLTNKLGVDTAGGL
jgi:hypothetical protein